MTPLHARIEVAKIRVKYAQGCTVDELDEAERQLRRRNLITPCHEHDYGCVVLKGEGR